MIVDELWNICNQLEDVENEVYSLDDELEEQDLKDIEIDRIILNIGIVMTSIIDLAKGIKKEEELRSQNETLNTLYKEYTTIRDLIGSEK